MQMKREMGEKGQVVLPKDIREYLSIKPGSRVIFEIKDGNVIIKPERTGKEFVDYFCTLSKKPKKPVTMKEIKEILDEQYDLP